MEASDAHPSHSLKIYWAETDSIHDPQWKCTVCEETECEMCTLDDDSPLAEPCIGFSWLDATLVEGPDGITRRVKKSGTGWPSKKLPNRAGP